jgi:hypothetical protein
MGRRSEPQSERVFRVEMKIQDPDSILKVVPFLQGLSMVLEIKQSHSQILIKDQAPVSIKLASRTHLT